MKLPSIPEIRKFISAALGFASAGLTLGLFHGTVAHVVAAVLAAAGTAGVFILPNAAPASGSKPAG